MKIKSNIVKLNSGGFFTPTFIDYRPLVPPGGGIAQQKQEVTKEEKQDNKAQEIILDLIKSAKGLPSDVDKFVKTAMYGLRERQSYISSSIENGGGLNNASIEDAIRFYAKNTSAKNKIETDKANFDKAMAHLENKGALNQAAITGEGYMIVMDKQGQIRQLSPNNIIANKDKIGKILTNSDIAQLRYENPAFAYNSSMIDIMSKAVGIQEIQSFLQTQIKSVVNDSNVKETYISKSDQNIKDGLKVLLGDGPEGIYKVGTKNTEIEQKKQIALNWIYSILPRDFKMTLQSESVMRGEDPKTYIPKQIISMLNSSLDVTGISVDYQTGMDKNGNISSDKTSTPDQALSVQNDLGNVHRKFVLNPSTNFSLITDATIYDQIHDKSRLPMGNISLEEFLTGANVSGALIKSSMYFGDQKINPGDGKKIIIDGNQGFAVTSLPYEIDSEGNYKIKTNLIEAISEAKKIIENSKITDENKQKDIYINKGLTEREYKYIIQGDKSALQPTQVHRFAMFTGHTAEGLLNTPINEDSPFLVKVSEGKTNYENLRDALETTLNKKDLNDNEKGDINIKPLFWFNDKIISGTIYIPVSDDRTSVGVSSENTVVPKLTTSEILSKKVVEQNPTGGIRTKL